MTEILRKNVIERIYLYFLSRSSFSTLETREMALCV